MLPTVTLLVSSLTRATSGRLVIESISNIGPHYARTLREWCRRFVDNFAEIEQSLRKEYPDVFVSEQGDRGAHELAVFRRKWLCEKSFYVLFDPSCLTSFFGVLPNRLLVRPSLPFQKILMLMSLFYRLSHYCEIGFTTRLLGGKIFIFIFIPHSGIADNEVLCRSHHHVHARGP